MTDNPDELDVFGEDSMRVSAERIPEPALEATSSPDVAIRAERPSAGSTRRGKKRGKSNSLIYGAAIAIGIGTVAWVFWPSSGPAPRMLPPTVAAQTPPPAAPATAAIEPSRVAISPTVPNTVTASAVAPVQPVEAPDTTSSPASAGSASAALVANPNAAKSAADAHNTVLAMDSASGDKTGNTMPQYATQTAFADLSARVASNDATLQNISSKLDKLANQEPRAVTKANSHSIAAAPKPAEMTPSAERKPKDPAVVRSLSGAVYTISSINRGVAFIQAGDHIEVVQPGDRIGTTRVLSIDPVARKIETSDGVIR